MPKKNRKQQRFSTSSVILLNHYLHLRVHFQIMPKNTNHVQIECKKSTLL